MGLKKLLVVLTIFGSGAMQATACPSCEGSHCAARGNKDAVFVVDWSKSSASAADLKNFLKNVIGKLDIEFSSLQTHDNMEAGIVYYRKNEKVALPLSNTVSSHGEICSIIDGFPKNKGQTNTYKGLAKAVEMFTNDGRPSACKVAVVVTDGGSDNKPETVAQAQNLHNLGTRMCVVQFGAENANQAAEIQALVGNNPDRGEIIRNEADPDNLDSLVEDTLACINKCPGVCGQIDQENRCSRDRLCVRFGTCCDDYEERCLDTSADTCSAGHHGQSTYQNTPQWPTCFCGDCDCFEDCCNGYPPPNTVCDDSYYFNYYMDDYPFFYNGD